MLDLNVKSSLRMLRVSPRKLNLVAGMIRGMAVGEALVQLEFSRKRISDDVKKCLLSAVANAKNNFGIEVDNLKVVSATVGKATVMKRFHCRARGRGARVQKFFSNLYITVAEL